ncbi:MAG: hypothetical protein ACI88H_004287 [Cocleimonas sp.]|jgi:hypothetical protein
MKNIFKVTVFASAVSFLAACGQEVQELQEAQKPAYAIGAALAKSLIAPLKRQEELGAPLDKAFIIQGIQDALNETTQLSDEELQAVLKTYDEKTKRLPTEALGAPINKSNTAVLKEEDYTDKMASYATIIGRATACGINPEREITRVGKWMDRWFDTLNLSENMRASYLNIFMSGTEHHMNQQKNGDTPDSCRSVINSFDNTQWP